MLRILVYCFLLIGSLGMSGCDLWMLGSEKAGYRITIETNRLEYADVKQIGELLATKGYNVMFKERNKGVPRYTGEVYSFFRKTLMVKGNNEVVDIYVDYVKDEPNDVCRHVLIDIKNWVRGGIVPELKNEIDDVGNLIYREIVNKVGRERVTVERFGRAAGK